MQLLKRFLPLFLSLLLFLISVLKIPYPDSLTKADIAQIAGFFIPLFFTVIFTANIFFKNLLISLTISLSFIFLLILKALNSLNVASAGFVIISSALLISYFKKMKKRNLTKLPKIPKLTRLRKQ